MHPAAALDDGAVEGVFELLLVEPGVRTLSIGVVARLPACLVLGVAALGPSDLSRIGLGSGFVLGLGAHDSRLPLVIMAKSQPSPGPAGFSQAMGKPELTHR